MSSEFLLGLPTPYRTRLGVAVDLGAVELLSELGRIKCSLLRTPPHNRVERVVQVACVTTN